jgi:hypothetical protein
MTRGAIHQQLCPNQQNTNKKSITRSEAYVASLSQNFGEDDHILLTDLTKKQQVLLCIDCSSMPTLPDWCYPAPLMCSQGRLQCFLPQSVLKLLLALVPWTSFNWHLALLLGVMGLVPGPGPFFFWQYLQWLKRPAYFRNSWSLELWLNIRKSLVLPSCALIVLDCFCL